MRHNASTRALLEREADLRAQFTKYSDLAAKTGYSEQYVAKFVAQLVRAKRQQVDVSQKHRRFTRSAA